MSDTDVQKPKRVRRTNAQIEADRVAEQRRREELAAERASSIPMPMSPKFRKVYHVVCEGGLTFAGKVWYRGEEIVIEEGTQEFALAFDRKNRFIFDKSENEQIEAYGEVRYREGPWPYGGYDLNVYEPGQVGEEGGKPIVATPAEIAILEKINKKRNLG